jgi:serine/threonine-protein kinase
MSPEAITTPDAMDARGDLYALGAVGYFMVTGSHVFPGRSPVEVCGHHLHTKPEPPSTRLGRAFPADLERLLDCRRRT